MAGQYFCKNPARRVLVQQHGTLNGIDYLEVLDEDAPLGTERQRTLLVHSLKALPPLTAGNIRISGGVRIAPVKALWAFPVPLVPALLLTAGEQVFFASLANADHILAVRTDSAGDYSTYALSLVQSATNDEPPPGFDPVLSTVDFSFKVECPSDFDCKPVAECPPPVASEPQIDYLARDYASFRRLMLDRLAVIVPSWQERNPADLGIALVELLAYAADQLSYFQDAVATEAYLGTARRRVSVRRHARLLDYAMHDGVNARVWVLFGVEDGGGADGAALPAGTQLLTQVEASRGTFSPLRVAQAVAQGAQVFEALHGVTLRAAHNLMEFHTWGDEQCCLPKGATRATLRNPGNRLRHLREGDVLVFEEVLGAGTGIPADADPSHRHAVRVTRLTPRTDPLFGLDVLDIEWRAEDALPFPLCVSVQVPDAGGLRAVENVSVARGNAVLADHGRAFAGEALVPESPPGVGRYRPHVQRADVTFAVPYDHADAVRLSAAATIAQSPREALPCVRLEDGTDTWRPRRDLLASDRFAAEFVVETESDGRAYLRFGDGVLGKEPGPGTPLRATYRTGGGGAGNVGVEAIAHVVTSLPDITTARNPMPAQGGTEPEPIERVRLDAPQAFRTQERAVTEPDYAEVAQRHPDVQKAAATIRWTGSWHTAFLTVDRQEGRAVGDAFKREMAAFLERYRMAGYDVAVDSPRYVPLDMAITVCVAPGYLRSAVKAALLGALGSALQPDGTRGFFHPDEFTFGQPVYLSRIIGRTMAVTGVQWVNVTRFQRWGQVARDELEEGRIVMDRLEIARLDNDANAPENGRIELDMVGGL